VFFVTIFDRI